LASYASVEVGTGEAFDERDPPALDGAVDRLLLHPSESLAFHRSLDRLKILFGRRDGFRNLQDIDHVLVIR